MLFKREARGQVGYCKVGLWEILAPLIVHAGVVAVARIIEILREIEKVCNLTCGERKPTCHYPLPTYGIRTEHIVKTSETARPASPNGWDNLPEDVARAEEIGDAKSVT
jgi:hypothetical protein